MSQEKKKEKKGLVPSFSGEASRGWNMKIEKGGKIKEKVTEVGKKK